MSEPTRSGLLEREKSFWNARDHGAYELMRGTIVRAVGEFDRNRDRRELYDAQDKVVLDWGCGRGLEIPGLIERDGARHVTGIDLSEEELALARELAESRGVADKTSFVVGDAHATGFPDDSFDLIVGGSILHHLERRPALEELRRILRPGGRAVLSEPLVHNPLLRLGRALTPVARTVDERPISEEDWRLCASLFPGFRHYERELVTIFLMPLNLILPLRARGQLASWAGAVDDQVLARWPGLGKYARITLLVLE